MTNKIQWLQVFLRSETVLTLSTLDVTGPWSAPVLYVDDFSDNRPSLYFLSSSSSRHIKMLNQCTGSSGSIYSAYSGDWREIRGVQMHGLISEVITDISEVESIYFGKFPEIAKIINDPVSQQESGISDAFKKSSYYCFSPAYVRATDNSDSFASRQEWNF